MTPNFKRRTWKAQELVQPEALIYEGTKFFWRTKDRLDIYMHDYEPSRLTQGTPGFAQDLRACIIVSAYNTTLDAGASPCAWLVVLPHRCPGARPLVATCPCSLKIHKPVTSSRRVRSTIRRQVKNCDSAG